MRYDTGKSVLPMGLGLKEIVELGEKLLSMARLKTRDTERERFEYEKQQFLTQWVTEIRKHPDRNSFKPMPGTAVFDYCESLTRDGILERDVVAGVYTLPVRGE
jgi:hypothetical protein